jgi:hypothetical protein
MFRIIGLILINAILISMVPRATETYFAQQEEEIAEQMMEVQIAQAIRTNLANSTRENDVDLRPTP